MKSDAILSKQKFFGPVITDCCLKNYLIDIIIYIL